MAVITTQAFPAEKFASKVLPDGTVNIKDALDILTDIKSKLDNDDVNGTWVSMKVETKHVETAEEVKTKTIAEIKEWLRSVPADGKKLSGEDAALLLAKLT